MQHGSGKVIRNLRFAREKMPDEFQKSIEDEEEVSTEPC